MAYEPNALQIFLIWLTSILSMNSGYTQDHDHPETHDAHLHGTVEFNIVVTDDSLHIEMISPAINIVGFEHKTLSDEEKKAVDEATEVLKTTSLISFNNNPECHLTAVDIKNTILQNVHPEESKEDHHTHHDHHDHHADSDDKDEHANFFANYTYTCKNSAELENIELHLFELFPSIEKINTYILTENKQDYQPLSKDNTVVTIK